MEKSRGRKSRLGIGSGSSLIEKDLTNKSKFGPLPERSENEPCRSGLKFPKREEQRGAPGSRFGLHVQGAGPHMARADRTKGRIEKRV